MLIRHLTLATRDPTAQAAFWSGLGLPVSVRDDQATAIGFGATTVDFSPVPAAAPAYHFAVNVPAGRIDEARDWIALHVPLLPFGDGEVQIRFAAIAADAVYFLDPDGNDVELIARDARRHDDASAFGPSHLLEVSEIGIATADVAATREAICGTLQAPIFWGDRHGDGLCAIGDDIGALLISPVGRGWIPIDLPARPLPTTVIAEAPVPAVTTLPEGPYRIEGV